MGEELGFFCLNYHCKTEKEKGRKKGQKQNKKKIKMNGVNELFSKMEDKRKELVKHKIG